MAPVDLSEFVFFPHECSCFIRSSSTTAALASRHSASARDLAEVVASGPQNPETTVALRKLLEAKDCAVRAVIEG